MHSLYGLAKPAREGGREGGREGRKEGGRGGAVKRNERGEGVCEKKGSLVLTRPFSQHPSARLSRGFSPGPNITSHLSPVPVTVKHHHTEARLSAAVAAETETETETETAGERETERENNTERSP